ncbi:MAG: trigger factor, partial [Pseudomonadota bacterium]|nr:trigger factor [Pseudomonadota bacterium]
MQVIDNSGKGLSRSFGIRVPAAELGALLEARIAEIAPTLKLKGFRPGHVPMGHVRRLYGKALMSEVVEKTLGETSQKVLDDHKLRIASRPDLRPSSDMDKVIAGTEDLAYDLEVEVMPEFEPADVTALKLERLVYHPSKEERSEALAELVAQGRTYSPRTGKAVKARDGDQLVIDFAGTIDGEAFEGGAAEGVELVLGTGQFIPGFEAQLLGAAPGAQVTVKVEFPADYQVERLKGRAARFAVTVKEVRAPKAAKADDALAQRLGLNDLAALNGAILANLEGQYKEASRFKLKRALLDQLDDRHDIALPPRMVEAEFESIWKQVEKDAAEGAASAEDEGKSETVLKAEYRQIARRRVRLGLVLAEIGQRENVVITEQELGEAMRAEATRYGEQAQQVFDLMRQNPDVQAQMRAPLYEEKVVDLIVSRAQVTDRAVTKEELLKEDEPPAMLAKPVKKAKAIKVKAKT